jgi:type II secretory ATPase GspE/PulE/Tfp pilus assembly ATPase PilB-like protein
VKRYNADHLSAIEVVDRLINTAIHERASDIHLEPTHDELGVRFRIDGMLCQQSSICATIKQQVISRLKVLAHIDIAEHRIPQDGGMPFESVEGVVDLRVSTFPSLYGQKMVVRILNRTHNFLRFDQLGLDVVRYNAIKRVIQKPQGLFLVTGPTGSGKTTTLYALLDYLNTTERNIITLEDPVEYRIAGITQGHIQERVGFSFAQGIRSLLRQDPDIIMVGEVRDSETAQTAIRAALTGHLVLSTLHTNDAPSAIIRLMDMGIEPYLLNAALTGVLAQRLVRVLCSCKQAFIVPAAHKRLLKNHTGIPEKIFKPVGCQLCNKSGYKFRVGVFEFLPVTDELKDVITQRVALSELTKQAHVHGMRTLKEDAVIKLHQGIISLEDFMHVV